MKIILAKLLLISFIGISVFGMFSMVQSQDHADMQGCIVEISRQGSCPQAMGEFDLLIYHLNVFRGFTQASISSIFSIISLILVLVLILRLSQKLRISDELLKFLKARAYFIFLDFSSRIKFLNWLTIREKSPAY